MIEKITNWLVSIPINSSVLNYEIHEIDLPRSKNLTQDLMKYIQDLEIRTKSYKNHTKNRILDRFIQSDS